MRKRYDIQSVDGLLSDVDNLLTDTVLDGLAKAAKLTPAKLRVIWQQFVIYHLAYASYTELPDLKNTCRVDAKRLASSSQSSLMIVLAQYNFDADVLERMSGFMRQFLLPNLARLISDELVEVLETNERGEK